MPSLVEWWRCKRALQPPVRTSTVTSKRRRSPTSTRGSLWSASRPATLRRRSAGLWTTNRWIRPTTTTTSSQHTTWSCRASPPTATSSATSTSPASESLTAERTAAPPETQSASRRSPANCSSTVYARLSSQLRGLLNDLSWRNFFQIALESVFWGASKLQLLIVPDNGGDNVIFYCLSVCLQIG